MVEENLSHQTLLLQCQRDISLTNLVGWIKVWAFNTDVGVAYADFRVLNNFSLKPQCFISWDIVEQFL